MAFTSRYQIRSIPHLRTGMNNNYDASEIADTDMADCENIEVDTKSIRSAAGYVDYGGDTGPFYGGFHAKFEDGTNRLIRQRGTVLEYDNGGGTWTTCTVSDVGSPAESLTPSALPCSFAMMNNTILWSNGTDNVCSSTDGITWTQQPTLPKSKVLFNNGLNRILYMAQPAVPSRVDWSDINQPLTVSATAYQFIGKNDGSEIMDAVLMPNGGMLLFKTDRFYAISDISFDMSSVDPIGEAPCVRYTACATENSAVWAGPDGRIYEFDGQKANLISDSIAALSITQADGMRGIYHNNKYRLAVPSSTDSYASYEYVVNRRVKTGIPGNPYAITKNQRYIGCYVVEDREVGGVRRTRLYIGDGRTAAEGSPAAVPGVFAYVNESHDTGITQGLDGVAQTCYFTTKFFMEEAPFFIKRYTKYFMEGRATSSQNVTLSYRYDKYSQWTDISFPITASDLDFTFADGSTGGFSEGYSFSFESSDSDITELETTGSEIRGVQFKLTWSSTSDIEIFSQAYKFLTKANLH